MAQLKDLIVTGSSRFLNDINGNTTSADQVNNNLTIQLNGGTTEGTNKFTFNGSTAKSLNITASSIGAGTGTVTSVKVGTTSYSPSSGVVSLPAYPTTLPASDTTSTYSASGTVPVNGTAVASALGTLDGTVSGSAGASKTLTAFSQTDGKVSATFGNISITKSQVSDFPTSMTPTSHTHGNIQNGGTLQTNDITIASGDKLVVTDSSDSNKVARTSISFDGSTATKALTQKGTWETFGTSNLTIGTTSSTAMAGNTNVNNVTQTATDTGSSSYEILFSGTADNTTRTEGARKSSKLTFNPSSGALEMGNTSITDGSINFDGDDYWGNYGTGGLEQYGDGGHFTTSVLSGDTVSIELFDETGGVSALKQININGDDIVLSGNASSQTWDGTNTSLKSSISAIKTTADNALPKSGGTMTGTIVTPADDTKGIEPATNNYGQVGSSSKKFYKMYATTFYGDLDGKVKQSATSTSTDNAYPILFSGSTTTSSGKYDVYRQANLMYNPSISALYINNDGFIHFRTGSDDSSGYTDIGSGGMGASNSDGTGIVISRSDNNGDVLLSGTNNTWDGTTISLKSAIGSIRNHLGHASIWAGNGTSFSSTTSNTKVPAASIASTNSNSDLFSFSSGVLTIKKSGTYFVIISQMYNTIGTAGKKILFGLWNNTTAAFEPNCYTGSVFTTGETNSSHSVRSFNANDKLTLFYNTGGTTAKVQYCYISIIPILINS